MRTIDRDGGIVWLAAVLLLMALSACGRQNGSQKGVDSLEDKYGQTPVSEAVMLFDTLEHDFGTIIEGEKVVCYFDYVNAGEADLIISSVEAACGCTTPGWSSEPLQSGEKRSLEIVFDSSGYSGIQRKVVTVHSYDSKQFIQLIIRANVINGV